MSAAAARPLLSTEQLNEAVSARFSESFLAHHPGYRLVRPALLPLVLPRRLALRIWRTTAAVLAELRDAPRRHFGGAVDAWVRALGHSGAEAAWLAGMTDRHSLDIATCCARADFVLSTEGPRLVEINVGPTVGGIGVLDRYTEILRAICDDGGRFSLPRPAAAWSRALRRFAPAARPLRVALVVADGETDVPHPHEAAHYLRREGLAAEVIGADAVRFGRARAETPAGAADILYGCFTFDQLREPAYRGFADRAMACHAAGGAIYFAPPAFALFGNKAMLAYLDGVRAPHPELLVPTRRLDATLLPFAIGHRASQVLKPAIGYGGEGVVIGSHCTPSAWQAALDSAVGSGEPHVLQDYVEPAAIGIPSSEGDASYHVGIGCLAFAGRFGGLLLRHTPAAAQGIANCRQGATFSAAGIAA